MQKTATSAACMCTAYADRGEGLMTFAKMWRDNVTCHMHMCLRRVFVRALPVAVDDHTSDPPYFRDDQLHHITNIQRQEHTATVHCLCCGMRHLLLMSACLLREFIDKTDRQVSQAL